jgi:hypothetical protein
VPVQKNKYHSAIKCNPISKYKQAYNIVLVHVLSAQVGRMCKVDILEEICVHRVSYLVLLFVLII